MRWMYLYHRTSRTELRKLDKVMARTLGPLAHRLTVLAAAALSLSLGEPAQAQAQAQDTDVRTDGLFTAAENVFEAGTPAEEVFEPGTTAERGTIRRRTIRRRTVRLDAEQLAAARQPGARLTLNLFDDATFQGVVERVRPTRGAGYVITAQLSDAGWGEMMLAVNGRAVSGTVETSRGSYTIRSEGSDRLVIREIDPSLAPLCGTPSPPAAENPLSPPAAAVRPDPSSSGTGNPAGEVRPSSAEVPGQPGTVASERLCVY